MHLVRLACPFPYSKCDPQVAEWLFFFFKLTRLTQTFWIKKLSIEQWSGVSLPWTCVPSLMTPRVPGDGWLGLPI